MPYWGGPPGKQWNHWGWVCHADYDDVLGVAKFTLAYK